MFWSRKIAYIGLGIVFTVVSSIVGIEIFNGRANHELRVRMSEIQNEVERELPLGTSLDQVRRELLQLRGTVDMYPSEDNGEAKVICYFDYVHRSVFRFESFGFHTIKVTGYFWFDENDQLKSYELRPF